MSPILDPSALLSQHAERKSVLETIEAATRHAFQSATKISQELPGLLVFPPGHSRDPLNAEAAERVCAQRPDRTGHGPAAFKSTAHLKIEAAVGVIDDATDKNATPDDPERRERPPLPVSHVRDARTDNLSDNLIRVDEDRANNDATHHRRGKFQERPLPKPPPIGARIGWWPCGPMLRACARCICE